MIDARPFVQTGIRKSWHSRSAYLRLGRVTLAASAGLWLVFGVSLGSRRCGTFEPSVRIVQIGFGPVGVFVEWEVTP